MNDGAIGSEYGDVLLDFTNGGARAIGANGLPELSSSEMKIIVEEVGKNSSERYYRADEQKIYEGRFPIGTSLKLTVLVLTKGGEWRGETSLIVQRGDNFVKVKLSKSAVSLHALKFALDKSGTSAHSELSFKLGFVGGVPFFDEKISSTYNVHVAHPKSYTIPAFCRDRLARTYVFYATESSSGVDEYRIQRFNSEGEKDGSFSCDTSSLSSLRKMNIVSDDATGNVFAIWQKMGEKPKVALVGDDGLKDALEVPLGAGYEVVAVAAKNGIFAIARYSNNSEIGLFRYKGNEIVELQSSAEMTRLDDLMTAHIEDSTAHPEKQGSVLDLYMGAGSLYVLYNFSSSTKYANFGGVLKYSYSVEEEHGRIEAGRRIVGKDEYKAENRAVNVKDENSEFFGALKFVGMSEDELYVADDGVRLKYDAGVSNVVENKNRLIALNKKEDKIFVKYGEVSTWLPEVEESDERVEPLLFYSKIQEPYTSNISYSLSIYADGGNGLSSQRPFAINTINTPSAAAATSLFKYTFDSIGNLYLITNDGISKYRHGRGLNYVKDNSFVPTTTPYTNWKDLFYDSGARELYLLDSGNSIYRFGKSDALTYALPNLSSDSCTIYKNKLYLCNVVSGTVDVYRVNDGSIDSSPENSISSFSSVLTGSTVKAISCHNDVLFFCYMKRGDVSTYVASLNLNGGEYLIRMLNESVTRQKSCSFLGFNKSKNEAKLSIDCPETDYDGRVLRNMNKYASIATRAGEINIDLKDAPSGIIWNDEWTAWKGTQNVMLWNKANSGSGSVLEVKYYAKAEDELDGALPASPSIPADYIDRFAYNSFCYDQMGNLYVLYRKNGSLGIVMLTLRDDGTYNFGEIDTNFDGISMSVSYNEADHVAMAACYLKDEGQYRIYYAVRDSSNQKTVIKLCKFASVSDFSSAVPSNFMEVADETQNLGGDWKIMKEITSMVANKDGLFIAERERKQYKKPSYNQAIYESYSISVKKYSHTGEERYTAYLRGSSAEKVATNMYKKYEDGEFTYENATWDDYIDERVTDMYSYNGSLYAITHKKVGAEDYAPPDSTTGSIKHTIAHSTGTIWKVGDDTRSFSGRAEPLHYVSDGTKEERRESGKFSPYHFIGILPQKLFIASDGFYGESLSPTPPISKRGTNYNSVLCFDLDVPRVKPESRETQAEFTFKLKESSSGVTNWEWE